MVKQKFVFEVLFRVYPRYSSSTNTISIRNIYNQHSRTHLKNKNKEESKIMYNKISSRLESCTRERKYFLKMNYSRKTLGELTWSVPLRRS